MAFYRPSSQKKLRKFFKKHNFNIIEGGNHCKAVHVPTGQTFIFPRHDNVSKGVTKEICDRLLELGYEEELINKIF